MAEQNMQNSSSGKTQTFNKGMNKDNTDIFMSEGLWYNAINAINNSHYGESGSIGNEPSNRFCTAVPYTIIGYAYIKETEWLIFSTNNVNSEIGIFNESNCTYTAVVNADCLNFKTTHLITAFVKENYDCTFSAYWQDNLNPDRTMNINDVPYICEPVSNSNPCEGENCGTQLDCDKIRLHPLIKQPCVTISKAIGSGQLNNGSYMATIAYSENGIRLTDYALPSVPQGLWRDSGQGGSIEIELTDLDLSFDEYELVVISVVTQQAIAKKVGYYNINQKRVVLDIIQGGMETVPLSYIPLRNVVYPRSEKMAVVNGYLIRSGVSTQPYINYQLQANKIKTNWVAVEYDVNFYWNGGNHVGYMRDEVYSFFIRWIYNTGNRTASYHIPGRQSIASDLVNVATSDDVVTPTETLAWQVYDTSTYAPASGIEKNGGIVIARGNMAYWESIERYPSDPLVWGDLCYQPIRHHKMPSNETTHIHNQGGSKIIILGAEFSNIEQPVDENCNPITQIVGYEILRGSREGNKSIVTKGIFANMVEFNINGSVGGRKGLFENYPYNDLRPDPFLSDDYTILDNNVNEAPWENASKLNKYKQNYLAFHSPEIHFERPAFGTNYIKIYTEEKGTSTGKYEIPFKHPRFKLLTDKAFLLSIGVGLGIALIAAIGKTTLKGGNFPIALGNAGPLAEASRDSAPTTSVADLISAGTVAGFSFGGQTVAAGTAVGIIQFIFQIAYWVPQGMGVVLDLIRNMSNYRNYLLQYNSHGFYSNYTNVNNTTMPSGYPKTFRRMVQDDMIKYIGMHVQDFDNTYRINNLFRTKFVCLKLTKNLPNPSSLDNSKKRVKDIVGLNTISYKDPFGEFTSSICQYYGAIKVDYQNQYGQLYSIVQLPTDSCVYETHPELQIPGITFHTSAIFGGDVYINRYTEKNPYFFFNTWMLGENDGTEYDYRNYVNGPAPRYWANYANYDMSDFQIIWNGFGAFPDLVDITTPADFYRLDAANNGFTLRFVRKNSYFYLFYNGVRDYFTESELNMAYRDYGLEDFQKFYDVYGLSFNDIGTMFRSDIIKQPTYYKYDLSLSSSKLFNNLANWGNLLPRDYNPTLYSTCFEYYPKRSVYSLQQRSGLRRDNWRNYLPLNYKDFAGKINIIKPLNATGCVILFEDIEPTTFVGQDQLQSGAGVKISIGDSGLFQQNFQSLVNADDALSYGSSISSRAAVNTPYGLFFVSQQIGKIFTTSGTNIDEISRTGLKFWFAENLPSKMLSVYPNFPLYDNPVAGIGVQAIYDSTYELLYFSKRDYVPLRTDLLFDDPSGVPYYLCGTVPAPVIPYVPPVVIPCEGSCPPGSIEIDGECFEQIIVPAEYTGETYTIDALPIILPVFCENGIRLYPDISSEVLPLRGDITITGDNSTYRVRASNGSGALITPLANVQSELWGSYGFCGGSWPNLNGRLNLAGIWPNNGGSQFDPFNVDICNEFCLNVPITKQYCIGIAGDNEVKIYIDGILHVYLTARNTGGAPDADITVPFTSWHVFPITLPAGTRNIRLCGRNHNAFSGFAGEVYDLTLSELTSLGFLIPVGSPTAVDCGTLEGALDPYILFSTLDYIGEQIPIPGTSGQYFCPDGSTPLENGCDVPQCSILELVPGATCPTCTLSVSLVCGSNISYPAVTIDYGQEVTLIWTSQNATSVTMNNGVGSLPLNGSFTVTPAGTMTYEIIVEDGDGNVSVCTVAITVNPIIKKCPCAFDDPLCFEPCNWTVSYDPKTKLWISFHDWNPSLMMPSYQNFYTIDDSTIWKHNNRWDSFCNYYGTDYPWEIEYPVVTVNQITTLRSFEYYLDVYKFYNDGKDFFHVLDENFDRAVVYNSEQISGILKMRIKQKGNPLDILSNPVPGPNYIDILYSKEENKYRFNQFYDITNDRGEFSGTKLPMWNTECSGYQKYINPNYVDYFKSPLEHKKIRNYGNRVILRKSVSGDNKMILKITNSKNLNSPR